jgi:UDPglucose 6-dehydrogenase
MNITVCGIGYVGLANAVLLAQNHKVTAFDISKEKIDLLNKRISPIDDMEIRDYLAHTALSLQATADKTKAYTKKYPTQENTNAADPDFIIIATPTDYDTDKDYFDTSSVESVIRDIAELSPSSCAVIKSTVPMGFTERMRKKYPELTILFSPEFLREGKALHDNLYPSRIIVGGIGRKAQEFAVLMLEGAIKKDAPICLMPPDEAEAVKLFSNAYLAMRIAFFNELDTCAELNGLDSKAIIRGMCLDPRIGDFYNNPSFGYGGYCLPKDTRQLKSNYRGIPNSLISAIIDSNKIRKEHISSMIERLKPDVVGIYKLSMKANSDNFRSSAVIDIIEYLQKKYIQTVIYEPSLNKTEVFNCQIINDFSVFCDVSSVILANRIYGELTSVKEKVYTRDIFSRD